AYRPRGVVVEGQSLGLAVLLAAWTAQTRRQLRPLVATGAIGPGRIVRVGHVAEKAGAVRAAAAAGGTSRLFLLPEDNQAELSAAARAGMEPIFVGLIDALFREQQALLTDR